MSNHFYIRKTFEGFWQNGGSLNKLNSIEPGKAYFIYK